MKALAAAVRRRPVRAYLYGLLVPGAAVAVGYGWTTGNQAALWITLGAAVLAVGGGEIAQTKTTPVNDPRTKLGTPAELVPENPETTTERWY